MRKILTSLLVVGLVAGAAVWGTSAFFSDIETSQNNVLAAGDIDLRIGNEAWYNGELQENLTWSVRDLTIERFFDFRDLKPGDWEEDTITLRVGSNDAWLCANAQVTLNDDNGIVDPEDEANGTPGDGLDGTPDGDLAQELNFMFWVDDGDNVFEDDETTFLSGPASGVLNGGTIALADSAGGALGLLEDDETTPAGVPGDSEFFIGKAFCYGSLVLNPVVEDGDNSPADDPGFTCDGSLVTNLSQTDALVGNLSFYAEQVRNNDTFVCSDDLFPVATPYPSGSPLPTPVVLPVIDGGL